MAQATLVDAEIEAGRDLIRMLVQKGFDVQSAAWIYYPSAEDWKLLIGSRRAQEDQTSAYLDIANWLNADRDLDRRFDMSRLKIVRPDELYLNALSKMVHLSDRADVRLTHNTVNGVYIDDALVYRLAA